KNNNQKPDKAWIFLKQHKRNDTQNQHHHDAADPLVDFLSGRFSQASFVCAKPFPQNEFPPGNHNKQNDEHPKIIHPHSPIPVWSLYVLYGQMFQNKSNFIVSPFSLRIKIFFMVISRFAEKPKVYKA